MGGLLRCLCATLAGLAAAPGGGAGRDGQRSPRAGVVTIVDDAASAETITIERVGNQDRITSDSVPLDPSRRCSWRSKAPRWWTCPPASSYAVDLARGQRPFATSLSTPISVAGGDRQRHAHHGRRRRRAGGRRRQRHARRHAAAPTSTSARSATTSIKARDGTAERISCGNGQRRGRQRPRRHHRRVRARRRQRRATASRTAVDCNDAQPGISPGARGDLRQRRRRELRRPRQPEPRRRRRRRPAPAGLQRRQPRIRPTAPEIRGNKIDENCDKRALAVRRPRRHRLQPVGRSRRAFSRLQRLVVDQRAEGRADRLPLLRRAAARRARRKPRSRSKSVLKPVVLHKGFREGAAAARHAAAGHDHRRPDDRPHLHVHGRARRAAPHHDRLPGPRARSGAGRAEARAARSPSPRRCSLPAPRTRARSRSWAGRSSTTARPATRASPASTPAPATGSPASAVRTLGGCGESGRDRRLPQERDRRGGCSTSRAATTSPRSPRTCTCPCSSSAATATTACSAAAGWTPSSAAPATTTSSPATARASRSTAASGRDTAISDDADSRSSCEEIEGDADFDGVRRPADCNDANAGIRPGVADVPDDGVDQDCSGVDATNLDADGDGSPRPAGLRRRERDGPARRARGRRQPRRRELRHRGRAVPGIGGVRAQPLGAVRCAHREPQPHRPATPARHADQVPCSGSGCPFRKVVRKVKRRRAVRLSGPSGTARSAGAPASRYGSPTPAGSAACCGSG